MIKNIIFDLGNVLLKFDPLEYLRTKLTDENKVTQVCEEIFKSEEWLKLDRGTITEAEAIENIVARSAENGELNRLCMDNWYEMLTPIEETVEVLKEIKAQAYKTIILSNFHLLAYENVTKRHEFFSNFDGGIISYQEKLLKPEAEIYHKLMSKYNIVPSESIFIDDTKVNIEAAAELGFKTVLYENPLQLRVALGEWAILG